MFGASEWLSRQTTSSVYIAARASQSPKASTSTQAGVLAIWELAARVLAGGFRVRVARGSAAVSGPAAARLHGIVAVIDPD